MIKSWNKYNENKTNIKPEVVQEIVWLMMFVHDNFNSDVLKNFEKINSYYSEELDSDMYGTFYDPTDKDIKNLISELIGLCEKTPEVYEEIERLFKTVRNTILRKRPYIYQIEDSIIDILDSGYTMWIRYKNEDTESYHVEIYSEWGVNKTEDDFIKAVNMSKNLPRKMKFTGTPNPYVSKIHFDRYIPNNGRIEITVVLK